MSDTLPTTKQVRERFAWPFVDPEVGQRQRETFDRWLAAHDAAVARQQAEHDAKLADEHTSAGDDDYGRGWRRGALIIARAIRAQFANPSTTPKETR